MTDSKCVVAAEHIPTFRFEVLCIVDNEDEAKAAIEEASKDREDANDWRYGIVHGDEGDDENALLLHHIDALNLRIEGLASLVPKETKPANIYELLANSSATDNRR